MAKRGAGSLHPAPGANSHDVRGFHRVFQDPLSHHWPSPRKAANGSYNGKGPLGYSNGEDAKRTHAEPGYFGACEQGYFFWRWSDGEPEAFGLYCQAYREAPGCLPEFPFVCFDLSTHISCVRRWSVTEPSLTQACMWSYCNLQPSCQLGVGGHDGSKPHSPSKCSSTFWSLSHYAFLVLSEVLPEILIFLLPISFSLKKERGGGHKQ